MLSSDPSQPFSAHAAERTSCSPCSTFQRRGGATPKSGAAPLTASRSPTRTCPRHAGRRCGCWSPLCGSRAIATTPNMTATLLHKRLHRPMPPSPAPGRRRPRAPKAAPGPLSRRAGPPGRVQATPARRSTPPCSCSGRWGGGGGGGPAATQRRSRTSAGRCGARSAAAAAGGRPTRRSQRTRTGPARQPAT